MNHNQKTPNRLTSICHPYIFALKEGGNIREDLLDYSLLLLQRNCIEVMRAPLRTSRSLLKF